MSLGLPGYVLVMIPTLNEEKGMRKVLEDVPKDVDVLVVDGGSTDETVEVARQYQARVIKQKFGRGKGGGVRTGMEFFLSSKYDVLCMIDGDGSTDPKELPKMIEAMNDKNAEVVLGSSEGGYEKRALCLHLQFFQTSLCLCFLGCDS